jgi:hypothetical protein
MTKARFLALAMLAATGCVGDLPPRSFLQDLRVLGFTADRLDAQPGETVRVSAFPVAPGAQVSATWTFCPFTVGPTAGDACAVPSCETPLDPAPDGSVTADPGALALACLQRYAGTAAGSGSIPSQVPDRLDVLFRYVASAPGYLDREAVLRVPFYPRGVPGERNLAPIVSSVTIGGQPMSLQQPPVEPGVNGPPVPKGGQLEVHVALDPASVQQEQDSSGRLVAEQLWVSVFTTQGRFDYDRFSGLDAVAQLKDDKIPSDVTAPTADVYVVAHDDRGGATVLGPYTVAFTR